jgi:putative Holliday junction resolvase
MTPIISIDVGTVRIGCAWGDDEVKIPFPIATWKKEGGEAEREILRTIKDKGASTLVVGLPLAEDGARTTMCDTAEKFARRIQRRIEVNVVFIDESFSSIVGAEHQSNGRNSHAVDALAACEILTRYFNGEGAN